MEHSCFVNGCTAQTTLSWSSGPLKSFSCDYHKISSSPEIPSSPFTPTRGSKFYLLFFLPILPMICFSLLSLIDRQKLSLISLQDQVSTLKHSSNDQSFHTQIQSLRDLIPIKSENMVSYLNANTQKVKTAINSLEPLQKGRSFSIREVLLILSDRDAQISYKLDLVSRFFDLAFDEKATEILTISSLESPSEIIYGTMSGEISKIDLQTQRHETVHKGRARVYQAIPFNNYEKVLITGDSLINIATLPNFVVVNAFQGHLHWIIGVVFTSKNEYMATASCDKTVKIWKTQTMTEVVNMTEHTGDVWSLAFSPDESLLASGGEDYTVIIWNYLKNKIITKLTGHLGAVYSIKFTSDGSQIITASFDGTIRIWDLKGNSEKLLHSGMVRSISLINKDRTLLSVSGVTLKIWDFKTRRVLKELLHTDTLISLLVTLDEKFAITGDTESRVWVWDLKTYELKAVFSGNKEKIILVEISEDFEWLAIGEVGLVRVYNLVIKKQVAVLQYKNQTDPFKKLINIDSLLQYLR